MRMFLMAAVAAVGLAMPVAAPASAAGAQRSSMTVDQGWQGHRDDVRSHRGRNILQPIRNSDRGDWNDRRDWDDRGRDDRDDYRHHPRRDVYLYNRYGGRDIDRSWQPDSFNDWWHDRPDRAYPAWMSRNQNCERRYWSGGDWRC